MDTAISTFIQAQTLTHIAYTDATGKLYCFSCFYAFDPKKTLLYLKFPLTETQHGKILNTQSRVVGTISMDKLDSLQIKGIQYEGTIKKTSLFELEAGLQYHAKHPLASMIPGTIWILAFEKIILTDYSKGLGQKWVWENTSSSI